MKHILLTALLLVPFGGYAQLQGQARLDSLLKHLPTLTADSNGVMLLLKIGGLYQSTNPDRCISYTRKAMALGEQVAFPKGVALAHNMLALAQMGTGKYPAAYDNFLKALKGFESLGDSRRVATTYGNIGILFSYQGETKKARDQQHKAEQIGLELDDSDLLSVTYLGLAATYGPDDDQRVVLDYVQKAAFQAQRGSDSLRISEMLANLGAVHANLEEFDTALYYQERALRIRRELGMEESTSSILANIGKIHLNMSGYRVDGGKNEVPRSKRLEHAQQAIRYLKEAIMYAERHHLTGALIDQNLALSRAYEVHEDDALALDAHKRFVVLNDSVYNADNAKLISDLETKRMVELKEKDIEIARLEVEKKRNERWFFIAGIVLLLGIMGSLFRSFRKQRQANVVITKEKKRSEDLLLNILPAEVAEELMDSGTAVAKHFEQATILFTDFKGFTQASETMTPQDLVAELNTCFAAFDHIITARGIEKIKTIGDAYMCVGGLPDPKSSSPVAVVHAALEMQAFMTSRKAERDAQGLPAFEMRVGIHTGPVVAGIVGVKKFQYDIWGDTVNTASRMESSGEVGQVNISETTYGHVKTEPGLSFSPRGKVQAKGKGEMEMYFVRESEEAAPVVDLEEHTH